jgi:hypothetical protein
LVFSVEEHEDGRIILSRETWTLIENGDALERCRKRNGTRIAPENRQLSISGKRRNLRHTERIVEVLLKSALWLQNQSSAGLVCCT